jgi:hypothetical protein
MSEGAYPGEHESQLTSRWRFWPARRLRSPAGFAGGLRHGQGAHDPGVPDGRSHGQLRADARAP